ncbi:MAG: dienelactone hydrolase [Acidobacteria bacterium]|jgi:predicted peptidase|nr:dienelactone hydrolase [Acidobacteriota bacterium]
MKIIKLLIFGLLISTSVLAETGFLDRSIKFKGEIFRYQIYVPADYTPKKKLPVIVFLHNNGLQGSDGLQPTRVGLADMIRENRSLVPAIVVFPQAKINTRWLFPEMEELVIAELDRTMEEFNTDSSRVYLTGFSMGATGAYRVAYRWQNKFAAIVAVAGRVEPGSQYTPAELEIDRKTNPFVAAPDPFASLALRIKNIPVWIFHGDADQGVPVEQSRQLVAALKSAGAEVHYTEYAGAGHVAAAQKVYADTDMIKWLFTKYR